MGAWGTGVFDNDYACDWKCDLEESEDLALVEETFEQIEENGEEYLESDLGSEALAACEVIARLKGNWGPRNAYTESLDNWVINHPLCPPVELIQNALAAIDRIMTSPSELLEVWFEDSDKDEWLKVVADLRSRVQA